MNLSPEFEQRFKDLLINEYLEYCVRDNIEVEPDTFIQFLLNKKVFDDKAIKRYIIVLEFNKLRPHYHNKTKTIIALSVQLDVSERTIWSALNYYYNKKS